MSHVSIKNKSTDIIGRHIHGVSEVFAVGKLTRSFHFLSFSRSSPVSNSKREGKKHFMQCVKR